MLTRTLFQETNGSSKQEWLWCKSIWFSQGMQDQDHQLMVPVVPLVAQQEVHPHLVKLQLVDRLVMKPQEWACAKLECFKLQECL